MLCKPDKCSLLMTVPAACLLFLLPSVSSAELVQGSIAGKSFFFAYALCVVGGVAVIGWLGRPKRPAFIRPLDGAVALGVIGVLANVWLTHVPLSVRFFEWTGLCLLYVCLRQLLAEAFRVVWLAVGLGAAVQAVQGNLQLWGLLSSATGFPMTGSFFNPGPYAGFLAAALPLAVGGWLCAERRGVRRLMAVSVVLMCLALAGSQSRAAWLAGLAGSAFLLAGRFGWLDWWQSRRLSVRLALGGLLVAGIVCAAVGLYHLKAASADGRWLVWKVAAGMVQEQPWLGIGFDGFRTRYMDRQAEYFRSHSDPTEEMLAGDTGYCFNEGLQMLIETGVVDLLVMTGMFLTAFRGKYRTYSTEARTALASVLSIAVFAMFSYPSQVLPIKAVWVCCLTALATMDERGIQLPLGKRMWVPKGMMAACLTALLAIGMSRMMPYRRAWQEWSRSYADYRAGNYAEAVGRCAQAYPWLHGHGDFLTYYGKTLERNGDDKRAIDILLEARNCYPNTIVYTTLGDCYKRLGQSAEAEQAYLQAWYMIPHRFYPKYLLAKLYEDTGQQAKAVATAEELLNQKVKVESTAIDEIQAEMKELIKRNKTRE